MRMLVIVSDESGKVVRAEVHDVLNEATWQADGGLLLEDGRIHAYAGSLSFLDMDDHLLVNDVLNTAGTGKYYVINDQLVVDEDWRPA